ncbi:TIGR03435 family protein [Terriglobus tenax]|uniref:TIGR03435 family protein n=1 Tax=Terriglobus tenax TaxID=1111115 RepID=UPI0021E0BC3B|nr:TIGR03435 family protein [Terriglobus tenax]
MHAQQDTHTALQNQPTGITEASIEVSVVKLHPATVQHNNFSFSKNRFDLEDQPIQKLIAFAYSLNARQIVNAPEWASEDHYDISGISTLTEDATLPQQQQLLRQLLKERFGLQFHREKREMSAYALQVVKDQPKLMPAADADAQPLEWSQGHGWERTENFRSSSMADFVVYKQLFLDRPLVDQTGLQGRYDFKLTYSYGNAPSPDPDAAPTMFTALKEQLGLRFEPVKTAIDTFVIDRIERPTPN